MKVLSFVTLVLFSLCAQAKERYGVGLMIGSPTGFTFEYIESKKVSWDAAIAYDLGDHKDFHLHIDYLRHIKNYFYLEEQWPFSIYYGLGLKQTFLEDRGPDKDNEFRFGPRLPVGVYFMVPKLPLKIFTELAVTVTLWEKTTALLDFGLGARFYF
jgi:hypothetical protein